MFYGVLVGGSVMLTDASSGKPIIEFGETEAPAGYHNEARVTDVGTNIVVSYELVPDEGTAEQAALALARIQFQSLPTAVAYELRALAPRYQAGVSYAKGVRFLDRGDLYTADEDFVAPTGVTPDSDEVPCTVLPDPTTAEEWASPTDKHTYNKGSVCTHNGKLYRSKKNNNADEPGTSDKWEELA